MYVSDPSCHTLEKQHFLAVDSGWCQDEEKHESEPSKEQSDQKSVGLRSLGDKGEPKRTVPPPLADWNRSQSFPPAAKGSNSDIQGTGTAISGRQVIL